MSAVGLEEMTKPEICEYALNVHGVKLRTKTSPESMRKKVMILDDTLENPLQVGEEVRYQDETDISTITAITGTSFTITDSVGDDYEDIRRINLTRVTVAPPTQETKTEETETITEVAESEAGVKDDEHYPIEIDDSVYRPKPGAIVIGSLPDDGRSTTRKTGVTHVLNDKV